MQVSVYRQGRRARPGIEQSVARRLSIALGPLGRRVSRIEAGLSNVNGDRRGAGRHCRIKIALVPRGHIIGEATEQRFSDAIRRAAKRAARQIRRRWTRRRRLARYVARRRAA